MYFVEFTKKSKAQLDKFPEQLRIRIASHLERIKIIYEQNGLLHRYFLDWRYKLIAGYIVIVSAIGYFLITWLQKPENYSKLEYIILCSIGITVTIIFCFIHNRITELIWICQNTAYLNEKDLGNNNSIRSGIYGNLLSPKIRERLDNNEDIKDVTKMNFKVFINPFNHIGALNWFFIIVVLVYFFLLSQISNLDEKKQEFINKSKIESIDTCK